jgi:hypothetical protein
VRRLALLTFAAALGMLAACTERLTTPADCPDQCPGNSLIVRDTVIEAIFDLDSTYTGPPGHRHSRAAGVQRPRGR